MIRDPLFRALSVAFVAPIAVALERSDRLRGRDEPTASTPITVTESDADTSETYAADDEPIQSDTTAEDFLGGVR